MNEEFRRIGSLLWNNIGHCQYCIKTAFLWAAGCWVGFGLLELLFRKSSLLDFFLILSISLTLLWMTHVFVFAIKAAARGYLMSFPWSGRPAAVKVSSGFSRRQLLPLFAKAFAFAAITTSVPGFASGPPCALVSAHQCQGNCLSPNGVMVCKSFPHDPPLGWSCNCVPS